MTHDYDTIIDCGVGALGNYWDIFDDLNATYKQFISTLMENMIFPSSKEYGDYMEIHTTTHK